MTIICIILYLALNFRQINYKTKSFFINKNNFGDVKRKDDFTITFFFSCCISI